LMASALILTLNFESTHVFQHMFVIHSEFETRRPWAQDTPKLPPRCPKTTQRYM